MCSPRKQKYVATVVRSYCTAHYQVSHLHVREAIGVIDEDAGFTVQASPSVWISLYKKRTGTEIATDVVALSQMLVWLKACE